MRWVEQLRSKRFARGAIPAHRGNQSELPTHHKTLENIAARRVAMRCLALRRAALQRASAARPCAMFPLPSAPPPSALVPLSSYIIPV